MFMFLFRVVFWLSLVVLVMPIDKDKLDTTTTQSISTVDALSFAGGALSDLSGFCARNPDVCVQGHEAFIAFSAKAKYVSSIALDYINEQLQEDTGEKTNNA
ncbi:MAG: DUF5330 domain-containing protein [Hyphomicrobiales bacterium]